jgi:iron only hydrogenase large subunit-like protein
MEAIRVHNGKATIMKERCIDCGECVRSCPNHAIIAFTDTMKKLSEYKYNIALPAPSFFGQFQNQERVEDILNAFLRIGFDEVFEVALAAEIVGFIVHQQMLNSNNIKKPLFSSECPAVLRLMQIKFPGLLEHTAHVLTPMEVAARISKRKAAEKTGLAYDEIGAFFISPCAAYVTEIRNPMTSECSAVAGVIGTNLIYKDIIKNLCHKSVNGTSHSLHRATKSGMAWGYLTGESKSIDFGTTLAVSEMHNVISLLEDVERGELQDVDFIELRACTAGCVGGPLNIRNTFVGRVRLSEFIKRYGWQPSVLSEKELLAIYREGHFGSTESIKPRPVMTLDADVSRALVKMGRLDQLTNGLPGLDCGACGSPSCRAFAEDIIRGIAVEADCVMKLKEQIRHSDEEIPDLIQTLPGEITEVGKKESSET